MRTNLYQKYIHNKTFFRLKLFLSFKTTNSGDKKVILRPVTLQTSGNFKCEVTADYPTFSTIAKTSNMLVVGED